MWSNGIPPYWENEFRELILSNLAELLTVSERRTDAYWTDQSTFFEVNIRFHKLVVWMYGLIKIIYGMFLHNYTSDSYVSLKLWDENNRKTCWVWDIVWRLFGAEHCLEITFKRIALETWWISFPWVLRLTTLFGFYILLITTMDTVEL